MNDQRLTPSIVPSLFTAMNMFCGFLSIVYASEYNFNYAGWLIIVAAIFDVLDGFMARITNSCSELGVELDSLADIISFGAAPAYLIYSAYFKSFGPIGIVISSLLLITGGFRLARFNVQLVGYNKEYFTGLPIPASAITVATFILSFYQKDKGLSGLPAELLVFIILLLSYLMISKVKYDTASRFNFRKILKNPVYIIIVIFILAAIYLFPLAYILFVSFALIVTFGIFRHIITIFTSNKNNSNNSH